ncbi:hypothetical protein [Celeribacter sp. SCSIO 80788]|uniref:hypothetical protein n=1 Tax=Celeribacter sp. SCSIO 80788 TaxID=3117013 RepID=UPI003DA276C9
MSAETTSTKASKAKTKAKAAAPKTAPATAAKKPHLFMMLFEATAGAKTGLRMGACHAIMVFMVASDPKHARAKGIKGLEVTGWSGITLKKAGDITGQKQRFKDKALDRAAQTAAQKGAAFVVYKEELKGEA